jgi:hypothetical protein
MGRRADWNGRLLRASWQRAIEIIRFSGNGLAGADGEASHDD